MRLSGIVLCKTSVGAALNEDHRLIPDHSAGALSDLYDNGRAVPDYPRYLRRWQATSAALRARVAYEADLPYGEAARQRIDLFLPECARSSTSAGDLAPLLIFLHGGYWQYLGKHDWSCVATPYLARGMAVAIVGYTLCPETSVAGIVEEIAAACTFLYLDADRYGLDRGRFHVAGHSAGGQLAAMMLATDWPRRDARLPIKPFSSGIAVSGVFDLEPLTLTPLNDALQLTPEEALAVSPLFRGNHADTPLLVVVGGSETAEFVRQSRTFCAAWAQTTHVEATGLNHFSVIDAFHDPSSPLFATVWQHLHAEHAAR